MTVDTSYLETPESAYESVRRYGRFTTHDEKHIRRLRVQLKKVVKIYENSVLKSGNHNWYPNHPGAKELMDTASEGLVKERRQVIRAAKRLLGLIG